MVRVGRVVRSNAYVRTRMAEWPVGLRRGIVFFSAAFGQPATNAAGLGNTGVGPLEWSAELLPIFATHRLVRARAVVVCTLGRDHWLHPGSYRFAVELSGAALVR